MRCIAAALRAKEAVEAADAADAAEGAGGAAGGGRSGGGRSGGGGGGRGGGGGGGDLATLDVLRALLLPKWRALCTAELGPADAALKGSAKRDDGSLRSALRCAAAFARHAPASLPRGGCEDELAAYKGLLSEAMARCASRGGQLPSLGVNDNQPANSVVLPLGGHLRSL